MNQRDNLEAIAAAFDSARAAHKRWLEHMKNDPDKWSKVQRFETWQARRERRNERPVSVVTVPGRGVEMVFNYDVVAP